MHVVNVLIILHVSHNVYLCVSYDSQNEKQLLY